jgi:hypothetical protein
MSFVKRNFGKRSWAVAFGLWIGVGLFLSPIAQAFTLSYSSALQGWQGNTLSFAVNSSQCGITQAALYSAIDDAIALWNQVPNSRIRLSRGAEVTTTVAQALAGSAASGLPTPLILCDPNMQATFQAGVSPNLDPDPSFTSNNIPGVTLPLPTELTMDYAVLVLNSESGKPARISNLSSTVLRVVIAHEIGHVLGLGHTKDIANLMYFDASERAKLSLSQDDMDGIAYLYPRTELAGNGLYGCGTVQRSGGTDGRGPGARTAAEVLIWIGVAWLGARAVRKFSKWRIA